VLEGVGLISVQTHMSSLWPTSGKLDILKYMPQCFPCILSRVNSRYFHTFRAASAGAAGASCSLPTSHLAIHQQQLHIFAGNLHKKCYSFSLITQHTWQSQLQITVTGHNHFTQSGCRSHSHNVTVTLSLIPMHNISNFGFRDYNLFEKGKFHVAIIITTTIAGGSKRLASSTNSNNNLTPRSYRSAPRGESFTGDRRCTGKSEKTREILLSGDLALEEKGDFEGDALVLPEKEWLTIMPSNSLHD
jgi:hypothetical protein